LSTDVIIGLRLKGARYLRERTLEDVAAALGTDPSEIEAFEAGRFVSPARLRAIATVLAVPLAYFVDDAESDPLASAAAQLRRTKALLDGIPAEVPTYLVSLALVEVEKSIAAARLRQ
jgi:transcriptional regulator with XRE-family HTH domain